MNPMFSHIKILDSLILMQLIKEGPLHGYVITTLLEENFGWSPSQTAIYNSLKSMENQEFVSVQERIEKGRAQKIYTITKKGRQFFEAQSQKLKDRLMKNFKRFFSIAQMVGDIEYEEDSEIFRNQIQPCLQKMEEILLILIALLRVAPEEAHNLIQNTHTSVEKIAKKHGIEIQEGDITNG
jgi:DNA-binding PadR family transcriptional regulator